MNEQDVQFLNTKNEEIKESQQQITLSISEMLNYVGVLEKRFDQNFNLSFVLAGLREKLESIDIDNMFSFIDDLDSEIQSLSYNYKRAEKANNISVYKVTTHQMPMYFNKTSQEKF